jgi:hypothetical protein
VTAVMFMRVLAMCNNLTPMFRDRPAMHEHQLLRRQSIADTGMGVLRMGFKCGVFVALYFSSFEALASSLWACHLPGTNPSVHPPMPASRALQRCRRGCVRGPVARRGCLGGRSAPVRGGAEQEIRRRAEYAIRDPGQVLGPSCQVR